MTAPASAPGRSAPPPPDRLAPPPRDPRISVTRIDEPTLSAYLHVLARRKWLVITLPFVFAVIAMLASMARPRQYAARAAFVASEPQSMSSSLGALSSVASQLGVPALSAVASSSASGSAQFYGDLLSSYTILRAVVNTPYDATKVDEFGGKAFRGTLVDYLKPDAKTAMDREVAAMRGLAKSIMKVSVDRPTGIVRLQVRTKNRELSALVARRLLDLVNDFNLRRRQTQAGAEREFALVRARAALDSLRAAEAVLADFRTTNVDFSRSPRLATREAELQRRVSLAQQIYTTVAQRYEMASIEAARNTPLVTVLDAPEGLVEAQSRHTAAIMAAAFALGLGIACAIALNAERLRRVA
jgi:uncharacterized protein involved in exopolysaccharide biosynthesis